MIVDLEKLFTLHGEWSDKTFGSHRDATPTLAHLAREVSELRSEPTDLEEYADCLLLLMDAARREGFSLDDILLATAAKFVVNTRRTWGEPDAEGVVEHVEVSDYL